jgi:hypothetical protein
VRKGITIPYPGLQAIVDKSGATASMDETELLKRLEPLGGEILQVVYQTIADSARAHRVRLVWVFLPQVRGGSWQEETAGAVDTAARAGFEVINLDDIYRDHAVEQIRLAEWDDHPNGLGHRLIARRLYAELAARAEALVPGPN